jgi:S1-C subfamily serine protease
MPEDVFGERVAAEYGFVIREPPGAAEPGAPSTSARPRVGLVVRDSTAQEAGLEVGDVIVTINDSPILTRDEARLTLARIGPRRPLRLGVRRGEQLVTVTISPPTS